MKKLLPTLIIIFLFSSAYSQNVGIGTTAPDSSAVLDISSTTQGFLLPRMTTEQKNAITNPAEGLEVYDLTLHQKSYYNGSVWTSSLPDALPTIQIGTQKWMSKNLDVAFYRNGDPIPQVSNNTEWAALTTGAWCYYNNDSTNGTTYGKLYNWYAVNDARGLAPLGWHIPSDAEWLTLETTLGGPLVSGGKMKEAGTLHWGSTSTSTAGNNNSGFTALPGGYRYYYGTSSFIGNYCYWWSSTELITNFAWNRNLTYFNGSVSRNYANKASGFSVRCLRD